MKSNAIILEDVCKSYGSLCAVNNINAVIPAGQIYGFLGPNGAGKTSMIRMIMNIISPDSGKISIMNESSPDAPQKYIGYMPEERGLYRKMTVRNILMYLGTIKGASKKDLKNNIEKWIKIIELEEKADRKVEDLSKGMQQKIQFLAAVIANPDILILDEPFSGLDPINLELVIKIIKDLKNEGKTLIISTHIMEQAEKLCDYILLINKGKKVIDGTLNDIQSQFQSDNILIESDDDMSFLSSMPQINNYSVAGKRYEINLIENLTSHDFLRDIVNRCRIKFFSIKKPSLHDIFIKMVKEND